MASGSVTSWQVDGETMTDFTENTNRVHLLDSKITAGGDCSHEIKRCLLFGRKIFTNLDSTLKSRDNFANQVLSSQKYGFSSSHVWM